MTRTKRLLIYKAVLIVTALLLTMFPSVADRMPQIDSRVMLTSMGLDLSEEGLEMTAAVTVPCGSEQCGGKQSAVSVKGISIGDLIDDLSRSLGKRADLAHCAFVVLGKELCEKGVKDEIENLVAAGDISDGANLAVCDGKAKDFIEKAAELGENAAFSLGSFISFASEDTQIPMVSLVRFANSSCSVGGGAYLPTVKMVSASGSPNDRSGGESGGGSSDSSGGGSGGNSSGGSGGDSGQGGGKSEQVIRAETASIFKDYRLVGEFDEEETFALTWLDPKTDRGTVKLANFEKDGESLGNLTLNIRKKGVTVKTSFDGESPKITVTVDAHLESQANNRLSELRQEGVPMAEINNALIRRLSAQLEEQFKQGWEKAEQLGADPFKYGYRLYKNHPALYEKAIGDDNILFEKMTLEVESKILLL